MKAIQIFAPNDIQLIDRAESELADDHVLIRVERVGYCGSDLAAFRGTNPLVSYPRIPGHEIGASIVQLGRDVSSDLKVGQRVLVIPYANCGTCAACRRNRPNCCRFNRTLGVQTEGALCEFFAAPAKKLIASEKLSFAELAIVEPLTVGFHAVARGAATESDTVAVFGCGAIGLGAIAGARFAGANVIAIDIHDEKLAKGQACGAHHVINSQTADLHQQLQVLTDGHGPSLIIEAVGSPACYQSAIEEVSSAGRVVFIGWLKAPVELNATAIVFKELDIRGSRNAVPSDFHRVIQLLESGTFPLADVLTRVVSLIDAADAMREWSAHPDRFTKIQIALDGDAHGV